MPGSTDPSGESGQLMNVARNHEPFAGGPGPGGAEHLGNSGPTVLRIGLGSELRKRREAAGISREKAGDAIRASTAKISRLELGRVGFKERDVADLLSLYGVHDEAERSEFLELARQANEPGWWHRYADLLPSWFETYLGLEQAATVIRTYELQFVPGLLQTREYARAVTQLACTRSEEIDRRVELRMRRQPARRGRCADALGSHRRGRAAPAPSVAPRWPRPAHHLLEVNEKPNVSLQIAGSATAGTRPRAGRSRCSASPSPTCPTSSTWSS
jgi:transcriptional regulator with XRE-family HTH domain